MEAVDMDEVVGADADDVVVGQTGIWAKFLAWLNATPLIPLPFLGLGVYRACSTFSSIATSLKDLAAFSFPKTPSTS